MRISEYRPTARLLAVQHAAYAIEAKIIGDDRIPPLSETLEELRAQPLRWAGAFDEGELLVGAVAWEETVDEMDINRLVVDPGAHRRGVGRALVEEVMTRADGRRIVCPPAGTTLRRAGCTSGWGSCLGRGRGRAGPVDAHYAFPPTAPPLPPTL